jgi:hypothetical protein
MEAPQALYSALALSRSATAYAKAVLEQRDANSRDFADVLAMAKASVWKRARAHRARWAGRRTSRPSLTGTAAYARRTATRRRVGKMLPLVHRLGGRARHPRERAGGRALAKL